jgi:triosephosphate isomerase
VIAKGADATGSTSGIIKAQNPHAMVEEMIRAVRAAYDERNG